MRVRHQRCCPETVTFEPCFPEDRTVLDAGRGQHVRATKYKELIARDNGARRLRTYLGLLP